MSKIKIIIGDSNFLSRKGLSVLISESIDFVLLAEALNTSDLLSQTKIHNPDLIIIDYDSANFSLKGLELVSKKFPHVALLAITEFKNNSTIANALNAGIKSHLLKDCDQDEIIEAIYKTSKGEQFMCGKIASCVLDEKGSSAISSYNCDGINISEREMEIIKYIAEGLSNKEVAEKLFLSTHTVTTHRKNIMAKLGINNTAGVVLFAVRENLISPNHFLFSSAN